MAGITLKDIPEKLYLHILKIQADIKIKKKKGVYSQESAVLKIIEEHKELMEKEKK
jgi:hypothetical protein